ncbi:MAG TPA: hypothetical protein VFW50_19905 [Streptosporangiaceae bacterium]|nr:hypothetical protein [Streptosporangiaceae bacterium]
MEAKVPDGLLGPAGRGVGDLAGQGGSADPVLFEPWPSRVRTRTAPRWSDSSASVASASAATTTRLTAVRSARLGVGR